MRRACSPSASHGQEIAVAKALQKYVHDQGGRVACGNIYRLYAEQPFVKQVIKGSIHAFCEQHPDMVRFEQDGLQGVIISVAPEAEAAEQRKLEERAALELACFITAEGGRLHSGKLSRFYLMNPEFRCIISPKVRQFLDAHHNLLGYEELPGGSAAQGLFVIFPKLDSQASDAGVELLEDAMNLSIQDGPGREGCANTEDFPKKADDGFMPMPTKGLMPKTGISAESHGGRDSSCAGLGSSPTHGVASPSCAMHQNASALVRLHDSIQNLVLMEAELMQSQAALASLQRQLAQRDKTQDERNAALDVREEMLNQRTAALGARETTLQARESSFVSRVQQAEACTFELAAIVHQAESVKSELDAFLCQGGGLVGRSAGASRAAQPVTRWSAAG